MAEPGSPGWSGPASSDEMYVGYLPTPEGHRRATRLAAAVLLCIAVCVAAASAWRLRDPGPAVWDLSTRVTERGLLRLAPYPHLVIGEERVLLGEEFKFGVQARLERLASGATWAASADDLEGTVVQVSGWVMTRGVRRMIALDPGAIGMELIDPPTGVIGAEAAMGAGVERDVTLTGELLDGKCYLGAMKPGDGAAHRACAMLCIRGGLPALFIADSGDERGRVYWATGGLGQGLGEDLVPLVARRVQVRGRERTLGQETVLFIESATPIR